MTDPAATLRAASDKLRGLTAAADHDVNTNPYWRSDLTDRPDWYANGTRNALGCPAGDLAAALTPAACADLADWLDDASRDAVEIGPDPHALTLAAHLLGEQLADAPSNSPTAGGSSRLFSLHRDRDISGVSGTGIVADGCAWPDGTVSIRWRGTTPSTVSWNSIADAEHVHGHGGATRIVWATGTPASTTTEDGPRCACGDPIEWMAHPDGSGWIHSPGSDTPCLDARPADRPAECGPECAEGHLYAYRCALKPPPVDPAAILGAAQQPSTIWIDGDPLMEAVAAAVWEHCATEGTSTVCDDPRNIAAAAALAARQLEAPPAADDTTIREALCILLSRVQRNALIPGEERLLQQHVEHLLADRDLKAAAARERADLLEETRDALEAAGETGAHSDDWPATAPGVRRLAADRDRLAAKSEALEASMGQVAGDALRHGGCHRKLMGQVTRAERAEATLARVRALREQALDIAPDSQGPTWAGLAEALDGPDAGQVDDSSPTPATVVHPDTEQQASRTDEVDETPVTAQALAHTLADAAIEIAQGSHPARDSGAELGTERTYTTSQYLLKRYHVTAKDGPAPGPCEQGLHGLPA